jgi:hypothetical protein
MDRPIISMDEPISSKVAAPPIRFYRSNPSSLYHGTNLNFDIGQVILPANRTGVESNYEQFTYLNRVSGKEETSLAGLREHAFATYDVDEALVAGTRSVERKGGPEARIFRVSPVDPSDVDIDPNSSVGVRSASGFRVDGELAGRELLEERRASLVTNLMEELRIDQDGDAFFLHHGNTEIKVGETIRQTSMDPTLRGMASDSLMGHSYAWDAMNPGSIKNALDQQPNFIYITKAPANTVRPDLNAGAINSEGELGFSSTNARAITRKARNFRKNCH